jgi:hypothetical protein
MHGGAIINKCELEAHKVKDKKGNLMIDRQRDIIIKVKKNCRFEYTLFYKGVSNESSQKEYIKILRCFKHTHLIYINPFSFKIHEMETIEYQTFIT